MADISQELSAIKNSVYGKNMRTAIHDAIKKVNEDGGGGGSGGATIDTLWSDSNGATVETEYTMTGDVNGYDVVYLKCGNSVDITANNDYVQTSFMPALIGQNENLSVECFYFKRYFRVTFANNKFTVLNSSATDESGNVKPTIFSIVGVKF